RSRRRRLGCFFLDTAEGSVPKGRGAPQDHAGTAVRVLTFRYSARTCAPTRRQVNVWANRRHFSEENRAAPLKNWPRAAATPTGVMSSTNRPLTPSSTASLSVQTSGESKPFVDEEIGERSRPIVPA